MSQFNLSYDQTLSQKAHEYAFKKYCEASGLKWKEKDGEVVCYADNEVSCTRSNQGKKWGQAGWSDIPTMNKPTPSYYPDTDYREWITDQDSKQQVCVISNSAVRDFCYNFRDISGAYETDPITGELRPTGNHSIGYYPGKIKCNMAGGYCDNLSSDDPDIQTCIITPAYCNSYQTSYGWGTEGLGECYSPDGQRVSESVIGATLTRAYRQSVENAIGECKDPKNPKCYLACLRVISAPLDIIGDMGKQWLASGVKDKIFDSFNELYNNPSATNMAAFGETLFEAIPIKYFTNLLLSKVTGILDALIDMIPGLNKIIPPGLFGKLGEYLLASMNPFTWISLGIKWGPKIWDYISNFGYDDLKYLANAIAKFGATVINALGAIIAGVGTAVWDLAKKALRAFTRLPVIVFISDLGAKGVKALDDVFGKSGYISQLFSGNFNENIKNFFVTTVGQKFFKDWIWEKAGLKYYFAIHTYAYKGFRDGLIWFVGEVSGQDISSNIPDIDAPF